MTRLRPFAALTVVVAVVGGLVSQSAHAQDTAADDTMVTVAVDIGETLVYVDVPRSDVSDVTDDVDGIIVAVSEDMIMSIDDIETSGYNNDPLAGQQWALGAAGFDGLDPRANGAGIVVAVLDTGVVGGHEELAGRVVGGADIIAGVVDAATTDANGHGTHVTGIIAAKANNGVGVTGGAPGVTVLAYRVIGANGFGSSNAIARAITAAADADVDLINLSLGGARSGVVEAAIADATSRGVLVVASAGNNGAGSNVVSWPAGDPNTLSVAATNSLGVRAGFSTYGPQVDIAAPGERVLATGNATHQSYATMSGTSMAAPYVVAAAADIWSMYPSASAAQVRAALESSAVDLGDPGRDDHYGAGLVNVPRALDALGRLVGNPSASLAATFNPFSPVRLFDTRTAGAGVHPVPAVQVGGGYVLEVPIAGLPIPAAAGLPAAVALNVTATNTSADGFVTVFPCGALREVSSLNYAAGTTVANTVISTVSPTATVCFYSSAPVDVIVDASGWYAASGGFVALDPQRLFDTRPTGGGLANVERTKLGDGKIVEVDVRAALGASLTGSVSAVSLNVVATNTEADGFVTVFPCGALREVSSLNYRMGATVANAVIVPVSSDGTVCFYASAATDIIVDINGWFAAGSSLHTLEPVRLFDARSPDRAIIATFSSADGDPRVLTAKVTDVRGRVPGAGVAAVVLNVTATAVTGAGYVAVYPCGTRGEGSSLNYDTGVTVANMVIAPVSADGTICLFSFVPVKLLVDISGWYSTWAPTVA